MIPLEELDRIGLARLADAQALFVAGRYDGATYMCGYAVEVALKARICRERGWVDFPGTGAEFRRDRAVQTHELEVLLQLSGQEARIKQQHFRVWNRVAVWKAESRYNVIGTAQRIDAENMIQATQQLLASL